MKQMRKKAHLEEKYLVLGGFCPKNMVKEQFFCALRGLKILILLNLAQKSLFGRIFTHDHCRSKLQRKSCSILPLGNSSSPSSRTSRGSGRLPRSPTSLPTPSTTLTESRTRAMYVKVIMHLFICTQNQLTLRLYKKPVYRTCLHKTRLEYTF